MILLKNDGTLPVQSEQTKIVFMESGQNNLQLIQKEAARYLPVSLAIRMTGQWKY